MLVDSFPISNKGYIFSSMCYISAALHGAKYPNTSTNLRHKHIRACQDTHNALALGRLSILHGSPCVFLAHHDTRGFLHQSVWNQLRPLSITPFFLTARTLENRLKNQKNKHPVFLGNSLLLFDKSRLPSSPGVKSIGWIPKAGDAGEATVGPASLLVKSYPVWPS